MRLLVAALLIAPASAGAIVWLRAQLPAEGCVAEGVLVNSVRADGGQAIEEFARARVRELLGHRIELQHDKTTVLRASLAALGGRVDELALRASLAAIARSGEIWRRFDDARQARTAGLAVALPVHLPMGPLVERLIALKLATDRRSVSAKWDFVQQTASAHRPGLLVDLPATVEAIAEAARRRQSRVELVVRKVSPAATKGRVEGLDLSVVVSKYETRFGYVGSQVGRAKNVARAAAGIDGLVMMPGEVVSFNALVGPRSVDNGFARAGEIYKGELRIGVGGGTCQAASTFHASAYLAGLDVVERSPHSRPSGYIPIGLDATVAYPTIDLKMRNPFPFAIAVRAVADKGKLVVSLHGKQQLAEVSLATATVGVKPYKRKIREAPWLSEGRIVRKQAGRRGVTIQKLRHIKYSDGKKRDDKTIDTYPPTTEIYLVPPGTDPEQLPQMPEDAAAG